MPPGDCLPRLIASGRRICGNVSVMSASVVSPVFVGRRDEMAALATPLRLARGGDAAFALIGGEAGVGKTRLVGELAAQAAEAGFTVLIGHCIELGAEGLLALGRCWPPGRFCHRHWAYSAS